MKKVILFFCICMISICAKSQVNVWQSTETCYKIVDSQFTNWEVNKIIILVDLDNNMLHIDCKEPITINYDVPVKSYSSIHNTLCITYTQKGTDSNNELCTIQWVSMNNDAFLSLIYPEYTVIYKLQFLKTVDNDIL